MSETKTVWHNFSDEKPDKEKIFKLKFNLSVTLQSLQKNEDTTICSANNAHYTTK